MWKKYVAIEIKDTKSNNFSYFANENFFVLYKITTIMCQKILRKSFWFKRSRLLKYRKLTFYKKKNGVMSCRGATTQEVGTQIFYPDEILAEDSHFREAHP